MFWKILVVGYKQVEKFKNLNNYFWNLIINLLCLEMNIIKINKIIFLFFKLIQKLKNIKKFFKDKINYYLICDLFDIY